MQPSFSVTLEPGLERGAPWGCDLYNFVTSAAGHMMRTLQKPRKNRRSKRQVNHRRFLHNMIQRKLADLEAANDQLASALHIKEDGKNTSSMPSHDPETLNPPDMPSKSGYLKDPDKWCVYERTDGTSKSRRGGCVDDSLEKKQSDSKYLLNHCPKPQPTTSTTRKNQDRSNTGQKKKNKNHRLVGSSSVSSLKDQQLIDHLAHDECPQDSSLTQVSQKMNISPVFSPGFCPLFLDSCDFSQEADIDLFSAGGKDIGAFMDVEAYFESICAGQSDVGVDNVAFTDQSESLAEKICCMNSEMEEYSEESMNRCPYGVQDSTINHFRPGREDNEEPELKLSQGIQNQRPTLTSYHYDASALQTPQQDQEQSPCVLNNHITLFEGVAQSFSVPLLNPEHRSIPTPLCEAEWLFTDILKDRTQLD